MTKANPHALYTLLCAWDKLSADQRDQVSKIVKACFERMPAVERNVLESAIAGSTDPKAVLLRNILLTPPE
jgi:hypothetical protein